MDNLLKSYFEKHEISYKEHNHTAVFTVEESKKITHFIPGVHAKNLFLKDEKGNFYLVCLPADKKLNIKLLQKKLLVKKLQFASPEELKNELNLTPGSVSIFGMINAKLTFLILDKVLWEAPIVGFHPNINTSTLEISHENLERFYNSLKSKKEIVSLEEN
jgi:Ala-tRNA(Pro) deacylase